MTTDNPYRANMNFNLEKRLYKSRNMTSTKKNFGYKQRYSKSKVKINGN